MRDSSEVMRRYFETAAGHLSQQDDLSQRESSSQLEANRQLTLKTGDIFDFWLVLNFNLFHIKN